MKEKKQFFFYRKFVAVELIRKISLLQEKVVITFCETLNKIIKKKKVLF